MNQNMNNNKIQNAINVTKSMKKFIPNNNKSQ